MANSPIDKSQDFIQSGMTLITELSSERYLKLVQKTKNLSKNYKIPENRYSRPCGGAGGFDDFVERWHE
jgi:hypothetical protein